MPREADPQSVAMQYCLLTARVHKQTHTLRHSIESNSPGLKLSSAAARR
jgi:hypothetical protein